MRGANQVGFRGLTFRAAALATPADPHNRAISAISAADVTSAALMAALEA